MKALVSIWGVTFLLASLFICCDFGYVCVNVHRFVLHRQAF